MHYRYYHCQIGHLLGGGVLNISEGEREYLKEMRMLTTDSQGNEQLVGLNLEESQFYLRFSQSRPRSLEPGSDEDRERYLYLNEKLEHARLSVIAAEAEARINPSSRH
jgi:hypothetical protein